jgi:hypothetical protein
MTEIEQPVYLGEVAIQTPRQFGLPHFASAHRHIECELGLSPLEPKCLKGLREFSQLPSCLFAHEMGDVLFVFQADVVE